MKIMLGKGLLAGRVSGADEALVNYAIHLQRSGHLHSVVLFYPPREGDPHYHRLRVAGIPVTAIANFPILHFALMAVRRIALVIGLLTSLPHPRSSFVRRLWLQVSAWTSTAYMNRCRSFFSNSGADLLHVVTPDHGASMLIRASHSAGVPTLYHELGTPQHLPELTPYYLEFNEFIPLCTEVSALSPSLAEQWQQRFPTPHPISVLPLIFNVPSLNHKKSPASSKKGNRVTFGFLARLESGKGPLTLIEALAELRDRQIQACVRVSGVGPEEIEARDLARDLDLTDRCEFLGYTLPDDKPAFMRSLDVFVLPSLAEGTPNSVVEAMAHGLPVIASAVGGIPDMVTPDCGILVPPGDAGALADAMAILAADSDLRARMGQAARDRHAQLFTPGAVLPIMLDVYARVAARKLSVSERPKPIDHPWLTVGSTTGAGALKAETGSPACVGETS